MVELIVVSSSKKVQSVWPSTRDAKAYIEDGSTDSSSNSNSDDNANPDQKTLSIKPSIKRNPLSVVRPNEIDIRARALIAVSLFALQYRINHSYRIYSLETLVWT